MPSQEKPHHRQATRWDGTRCERGQAPPPLPHHLPEHPPQVPTAIPQSTFSPNSPRWLCWGQLICSCMGGWWGDQCQWDPQLPEGGWLQEQPCATETPQHPFYWQTAQTQWGNLSSTANMAHREVISSPTLGSAAAPAY